MKGYNYISFIKIYWEFLTKNKNVSSDNRGMVYVQYTKRLILEIENLFKNFKEVEEEEFKKYEKMLKEEKEKREV